MSEFNPKVLVDQVQENKLTNSAKGVNSRDAYQAHYKQNICSSRSSLAW